MPNRLATETSPYLLQHAHNPVDWYPWGEEALERARSEDKPILLSIGYAACHWCHVMERESFEDDATAALMNEHFVSIKVDREERPDLDAIYMDAVQAMTGRGGWPLTVFLTPDGSRSTAARTSPTRTATGCPRSGKVLAAIADDVARAPRRGRDAERAHRRRRSVAPSTLGASRATRSRTRSRSSALEGAAARRSTRRGAASAARRSSRSR